MNATKKNSSSTRLVIAAVIVAIVAAFVVAIAAGGSSDDGDSAVVSDSTTAPSGAGTPGETQPVDVRSERLAPLEDEANDPAVGQPAPVLFGADFDGSPVSIEPGDGKNHLVVFLAHWCPHCNAEIPVLLEWKANGMVPADLEIIGVSTASSADRPNYPPSRWLPNMGWPWATMADSGEMAAAEAYGVTGYPFMVIVGPDGTVKGRTSGEKGLEALDAWVSSTLGG